MALDKWTYIEKDDAWMSPKGRSTFVALDRKVKSSKDAGKDDKGQFAVTLIFPPNITHAELKPALNDVAKEKFPGADLFNPAKSKIKGLKSPILKADEKVAEITSKGEEVDLEGWTMIRANSKRGRPSVRDSQGNLVDEDDLAVEAYSGRWMRFIVRPSAYDVDGGKGVKLYVDSVQLLGHDDAIGGYKQSDGGAFTAVEDEDEDDGI